MGVLPELLILFVALEHLGFLVLEMVLWEKPIGRKIFRTTEETAKVSAPLAANQGLYNGFLATGLIWSVFTANAANAVFFLGCVSTAGIFGAFTVSARIFAIQAVPAMVAIALLYLSR